MTINRNRQGLNDLLQVAINEVKDAGLVPGYILKDLGVDDSAKRFGCCESILIGYKISISKYLVNAEESRLKQTLVHEVLHTIEGCMNHGPKWRAAAEKVNKVYGYNIERLSQVAMENLSTAHQAVLKKYSVACVDCDNVIHRQIRSKLIKHPELYGCSRCGGDLKNV